MTEQDIVRALHQDQVVAYPTEAVFGLGCNPMSENAVRRLLSLKQRPMEKGLILIAHDLDLLLPYIQTDGFDEKTWQKLTALYDHPTTWVVPAKASVPRWLTGQFDSIAVRLCRHAPVRALCEQSGFALTSTSANLSGQPPAKSAEEVRSQFGAFFPVLDAPLGNAQNPSEIRDIFSETIIRKG